MKRMLDILFWVRPLCVPSPGYMHRPGPTGWDHPRKPCTGGTHPRVVELASLHRRNNVRPGCIGSGSLFPMSRVKKPTDRNELGSILRRTMTPANRYARQAKARIRNTSSPRGRLVVCLCAEHKPPSSVPLPQDCVSPRRPSRGPDHCAASQPEAGGPRGGRDPRGERGTALATAGRPRGCGRSRATRPLVQLPAVRGMGS